MRPLLIKLFLLVLLAAFQFAVVHGAEESAGQVAFEGWPKEAVAARDTFGAGGRYINDTFMNVGMSAEDPCYGRLSSSRRSHKEHVRI